MKEIVECDMCKLDSINLNDAFDFRKYVTETRVKKSIENVKNGSVDSSDLFYANVHLALSAVKKCLKSVDMGDLRVLEVDDFVALGMEALHNASLSFDPTNGTKFSTYAVTAIKNSFFLAFNSHKGVVYMPKSTIRLSTEIARFVREYKESEGAEPSADYVAESLGVEKSVVLFFLSGANDFSSNIDDYSVEAECADEDDICVASTGLNEEFADECCMFEDSNLKSLFQRHKINPKFTELFLMKCEGYKDVEIADVVHITPRYVPTVFDKILNSAKDWSLDDKEELMNGLRRSA